MTISIPTNMNAAPIILFTYNRPIHLKRCIESLLRNPLASQSTLYIYSDCAKDQTDKEAVNNVRAYIHSIQGFGEIHITERQENWGLAKNVIDGVTSIVNAYGKAIILEDDLIVAPYFLLFMNDALETYKDEEKIGHIQAYDFTNDPTLPDTFLIKWTGSWGWATWDRAWKHFNSDGKYLLEEIKRRNLQKVFDFNGKYDYTRMLENQVNGKNNSWAIRWNASLFLADILSLNVGRSLVQNTGFDGTGTNCGGGNLYAANLYLQSIEVKKIYPIQENQAARNAYIHYYARTNSFLAKAIRRVKRTLKGDFGK